MNKNIRKTIDLHEFLKNINLDEKETNVYLRLLELGSTTITDLSRDTEIAKTTLYRIIHKLQRKSLVSTTERNEVKLLTAESPERLGVIIKEMHTSAKSKLSELEKLTNDLPVVIESILETINLASEENPPLVKY